jgi:hypothetical protein
MRKLLIAAAAVVALLVGCSSDDPIDSAESCTELEIAMNDAADDSGDDQEAWAEVVPRVRDRYNELSCTFVIREFVSISSEL